MEKLAFIDVCFESNNTEYIIVVEKSKEKRAKEIISSIGGDLEKVFEYLKEEGIEAQEVETDEIFVIKASTSLDEYDEAIDAIKEAFVNLNNIIDDNDYFNKHYSKTYPFALSFDELTEKVLLWEDSLKESM